MFTNNCHYSATGTLVCPEHYTEPKDDSVKFIRIEDSFYDGIPKRLLLPEFRGFAFCVKPENNTFVVNKCYNINNLKIKVRRIDKKAHLNKDIIHFSIPELEQAVKFIFKSYTNAQFSSEGC